MLNEPVFELYPNPVSNVLTIYQTHFEDVYRIELFDISGKLVFGTLSITNKQTLDISNLERGIYIISISNGSKRINNKIIKS